MPRRRPRGGRSRVAGGPAGACARRSVDATWASSGAYGGTPRTGTDLRDLREWQSQPDRGRVDDCRGNRRPVRRRWHRRLDPRRRAAGRRVTVTDVFETHILIDYVTGGLALARVTGATYHVNAADPKRNGRHA